MIRMKAKLHPVSVARFRWVCDTCREDVEPFLDREDLYFCGCRDRVWERDGLLKLVCTQSGPAGGLYNTLCAVVHDHDDDTLEEV